MILIFQWTNLMKMNRWMDFELGLAWRITGVYLEDKILHLM